MTIPKVLLIGGSGYVGSYLYPALANRGIVVDVCDRGSRGSIPLVPVLFSCDAIDLSSEVIGSYDHILWFAGTSNVKDSLADPARTMQDNVVTLTKLATAKRPNAHLTYASTASVYSSAGTGTQIESSEYDQVVSGTNAYDLSKYMFDLAALSLFENTTALRMGTVCGYAPQLRPELIFNAMCLSLVNRGVIKVFNGSARRTILFLDHLENVVFSLIHNESLRNEKIINVGSLNCTVAGLAEQLSYLTGCEITREPDSLTYSFQMKHEILTRFGLNFRGTLDQQVFQFINDVKGNNDYSQ